MFYFHLLRLIHLTIERADRLSCRKYLATGRNTLPPGTTSWEISSKLTLQAKQSLILETFYTFVKTIFNCNTFKHVFQKKRTNLLRVLTKRLQEKCFLTLTLPHRVMIQNFSKNFKKIFGNSGQNLAGATNKTPCILG